MSLAEKWRRDRAIQAKSLLEVVRPNDSDGQLAIFIYKKGNELNLGIHGFGRRGGRTLAIRTSSNAQRLVTSAASSGKSACVMACGVSTSTVADGHLLRSRSVRMSRIARQTQPR